MTHGTPIRASYLTFEFGKVSVIVEIFDVEVMINGEGFTQWSEMAYVEIQSLY